MRRLTPGMLAALEELGHGTQPRRYCHQQTLRRLREARLITGGAGPHPPRLTHVGWRAFAHLQSFRQALAEVGLVR